jgi:hypothetical protein
MYNLIHNIRNDFTKNKSILNIYNIFNNIKSIKYDLSLFKINNNTYTKYIIDNNKYYELIIIAWDKNVRTKYHYHPSNGCVMKVLDGVLIEDTIKEYNILYPRDTSIKFHKDIHSIYTPYQSYSLHFYSPPNYYNK